MTDTRTAWDGQEHDGIESPRRLGRSTTRYGTLAAAAVTVFALSASLGVLIHRPGGDAVRETVIGRCNALHVSDATKHAKNDFTKIVPGRTTAVSHPDHGWTVTSPLTLSGHIVNGVRDADRVEVTKTCTFSPTAARSRTARPERLSIHFDGTKALFTQEFVLDRTGEYSYTGGSGIKGP